MQLAMNASHAPRRSGSVACCACSKHKYSMSLGAAKAGVALINGKKVSPTSTHLGFKVLDPLLVSSGSFISPLRFAFNLILIRV